MGRFLFVFSAAIAGLALAVVSAWLAIDRLAGLQATAVAGWTGSASAGSSAADPWTRAAVARGGLLALARTETIYFTRNRDSAGRRLSEACSYHITGGPLPARWWSLTLYDASGYLARNGDDAHSIDATRAGPGAWEAFIGPVRAPGPWLSNVEAGDFSLLVRLYNPDPAAAADPARIAFPTIERIACQNPETAG